MNAAHVHLLVNHVPVIGAFVGLALLAWGVARSSEEAKRLALGTLVLVGLASVPAYFSGKGAEEVVEDLAGVGEARIEEHEDSALASLVGAAALGVVALVGLWSYSRSGRLADGWMMASLLLSIVVCGLMAYTANLGGQIRHEESRPGFSPRA